MSTASPAAIASIQALFEDGARQCLAPGADDQLVLAWQGASAGALQPAPRQTAGRHTVVLSIVSYGFRIVALFDFDTTPASLARFAQATSHPLEELEGQAFTDLCAETVNMICGTVNRRLAAIFRHVGMSTPVALESSATHDLALLSPTWLSHAALTLDTSPLLNLALCICVAPEHPLDFRAEPEPRETEGVGELELF